MDTFAKFEVCGTLADGRTLIGKDGKPWLFSARINVMGGSVPVQTKDLAMFAGVSLGEPIAVTGVVDSSGGHMSLVVGSFRRVK